MDQDATWYTEVGLGSGLIALNGDPAPPDRKGHSSPPLFGPCLLWPNGRPPQQLLSSCTNGHPKTANKSVLITGHYSTQKAL